MKRHREDLIPWHRKKVSINLPQGTFSRYRARIWELRYTHINEMAVRAHDLLDGDGVMRNKKLTNCLIEGPIIIEPEEDWPINNCHWDKLFPDMFYPREDEPPYGIAKSIGCDFKDCIFKNVRFRVKRSELERVRSEYGQR